MPELLQVLDGFRMASPVLPGFRVFPQRSFRSSYRCRIQHSVTSGDASCKPGHLRAAKIGWNVSGCELEPTMPFQGKSVLCRELSQKRAGWSRSECWIGHQQLNIFVQGDGSMNLGFDSGIKYAGRPAESRIAPGLSKIEKEIQQPRDGQVGHAERWRAKRRPGWPCNSALDNLLKQGAQHSVHSVDSSARRRPKRWAGDSRASSSAGFIDQLPMGFSIG
jgi:hypothetical protein